MASVEYAEGYDSSEVEGNGTRISEDDWNMSDELLGPLFGSLLPFVIVVDCENFLTRREREGATYKRSC
jgi:hypothetical protein